MRLRFIHAADIHLGYRQYNLDARFNDFARAYFAVADHAIQVGADFVLIAGDLFHHARPDAWTLKQATVGLDRLRHAGIPVVAIEGNHDTTHHQRDLSWLEYLCDQELLTLLNVQTEPNGLRSLVPFDPQTRRGSSIELAGARIYGIKYYGATTARILEGVVGDIEPGPNGYTIMMLHSGMEGQVPNMHGGLTRGQIEPLRAGIDYLALGHVHKRLQDEDWIFNPGSTEVNSFEEIEWPHGFFDVRVDTTGSPKHQVTPVETPTLRPFRRISISADGVSSLDEYVARVEERIAAARGVPEKAVVELHLGGVADFRRQDLPVERLKGIAEVTFSPLTVRVRNNLVPPGIVHVTNRERLPRGELERQIVEHLVYQNAEYRDSAAAWARLILQVKNMTIDGDIPASITDHIRRFMSGQEDEVDERQASMADHPQGATVPSGAPEDEAEGRALNAD
jgi:DNA repair exonuclease SbcCD nuclease subunit